MKRLQKQAPEKRDILRAVVNTTTGRPRVLSPSGIEKLKAQVKIRDERQDSFTAAKFEAAVVDLVKQEAVTATGRADNVRLPSARTVYRIRREAAPLAVDKPTSQNMRRLHVGMDVRNSISAAVTAKLAMDPTNPRVRLETLTNTDVTSIDLVRKADRVYVAADSPEKLKLQGKSVGITEDGHQRRCLQLMATTSAAGELLCTIAVLRDSAVAEFKKILVRRGGMFRSTVHSSLTTHSNSFLPSPCSSPTLLCSWMEARTSGCSSCPACTRAAST